MHSHFLWIHKCSNSWTFKSRPTFLLLMLSEMTLIFKLCSLPVTHTQWMYLQRRTTLRADCMNATQISTQLSPLNNWVHSTYWVYSNPHSNKFHCMKRTRSQFESTYLSENLSDLFRKQLLWLVHDDIIRNYKHSTDDINAIYGARRRGDFAFAHACKFAIHNMAVLCSRV